MKLNADQAKRFESKMDKSGRCWLWTGYLDKKGYGRVNVNSKVYRTHRVSYAHFVGDIPEGLDVDHLCSVRHCVRPTHLEAVSHKVNILRGDTIVARNKAKSSCPHGHPYNEENTLHVVRRGGTQHRVCRMCRRAYDQRLRAAQAQREAS